MICKALCQNKELLISDEWTTHLDEDWISKINQIFIEYQKNGGFHLEFHSHRNTLLEIVGKNGTGKTTLLKEIWKKLNKCHFFFRNQQSVVFIPTNPIYHLVGTAIRDELQKIGVSDNENISMIAKEIIVKDINTDVFALSSEKRKLLSLLIALLSNQPIVLIDEPFAALDTDNEQIVIETIKYVVSKGKMIIVTGQKTNPIFGNKIINL
jgi:ABC-type multidrug transport system ATPase subunit